MTTAFPTQDTPDSGDRGVLEIGEHGVSLDEWTDYRWDSDFMVPADDFEFTVAADRIPSSVLAMLTPGTRCSLKINSALQATGYIDDVEIRNDAGGGTEIHVRGRDALAPVVDGCIDPTIVFSKDQTLEAFLRKIFVELYGFEDVIIDNADNRGVLQGQTRGPKTTKKGKPLKSYVLYQLKPKWGEGAFEFAARVAQRHGIWLWATADGTKIVASQPNYGQPASYRLTRTQDGVNTILDGGVARSGRDQPSVIVATGFGGGGDFAHAYMKGAIVNGLTGLDDNGLPTPFVDGVLGRHPNAKFVELLDVFPHELRFARTMPRALFLHDEDSHSPEHLQNFLLREMSLKQLHAYAGTYTVRGHTQNGTVWAVDTIVDVKDDRSQFDSRMWIMRRTFVKSRSAGTLTHLHTILPYTLLFDQVLQAP